MSALALVDCNNFFVSCERVFSPRLEKRPVIVLSNNDGCVISRSEQAKALGIPMGAPFFEVRSIVLEHEVAAISANHELYVDMSRRVSIVLASEAAEIESYSIDESFLRLPPGPAEGWAWALRERIRRWTGLPVSVGLGPTKLLAKFAADRAKKSGGVFSLCDPAQRDELLRELPVGELWGVAEAGARRLGVYGLRTAGALAAARESAVRAALGVSGLKLAAELRGEPCFPLNGAAPMRQSVTVSRSFGRAISEREALWAALCSFLSQAAERLRRHGLLAGEVRVYLGWREDGQPRAESAYERIAPDSATPPLLAAAARAFAPLFQEERAYRKAGIVLSLLVPEDGAQGSLFDDPKARRLGRLMKALDGINAEFGAGALRYAGGARSSRWASRCENRSPCYTTRWEDLPRIKA